MLSKTILKLQVLSRRPYFTTEEVAESLGIQMASARVFCSRYAKQGLLIKLKNGYYITSQKWDNSRREDRYSIANILQVPSYISFLTALAYYEITSQVQRDFVENACLKRSVSYEVKGTAFKYYKLKKKLYFDFVKQDGIFLATREKAFLDTIYLFSFGKYKIDLGSLDIGKLDQDRIRKLVKAYPAKTRKIVVALCKI